MTKLTKRLITISGIIVLLATAGGIWFNFNWHRMPGIIASWKNPTYENRVIEWQDGPTFRTSEKPNVIVILVDDLGFNEVSSYGGGMANGKFKTPNIDQLASDGVLCKNGYSTHAVCSPSRASLLTGRYSSRFGYEFTPTSKGMGKFIAKFYDDFEPPPIYNKEVDDALPSVSEMGLPPSEITIAEMLKPQGYHSVHIGKWHLGGSEKYKPINHGFDESLWIESGSMFLPEDDINVVNAKLDFDPIDKFLWANLPYAVQFNDSPRFKPKGFLTDYLTNEAVNVIEKNKNQPFFLYLAYWAVHTPLQALKEDYDKLTYIEDRTERVQASMVMAVDRGVGKVRKALKDNGILDNTIIVFTSDNGAPGYIGLPDVNKPYRGWKLSLFEGGIHVPYIVSYPDSIAAGQVYNGRVSNVDLFSTFGALVGAELPADRKLDGENILPFLMGKNEGEPNRPLFSKAGNYAYAFKDGWKLQVENIQKKKWLFNLNNDPTEQNNLFEKEQGKTMELMQILEDFLAEQSEPIWKGATYVPNRIDKTLNAPKAATDEYIYWQN